MKHIFLVLVMILLVGSASVAAADFSWVLWEKRQWEQPGTLTARLGTPFWHLKGAYTTHENCMAERDRQFRFSANRTKLRTALRRKSCRIIPVNTAFLQAVRLALQKSRSRCP